MHELYELKEKLMKELEEYSQNGKFSKEDAENIKYIASAIDHICNIVERAEDEYSQRGVQGGRYSYEGGQGGNQGYSRNRGGGYSREGGSYSRGRGRNAQRDSMGRYSRMGDYSRADGVEEMVESIRAMMGELPQEVQQDAQRFVQKLEQQM